MLGGYALYFTVVGLGLPPILCLFAAILGGVAVGFSVERLLIRDTYTRVMARPLEYAMLGTMMISVLLQNLAVQIFGPYIHSTPPFVTGSLQILQVTLSYDRVVASAISLASLLFVYYLVQATRTGRAWRAVAQNRVGAIVSGISVSRVNLLAYGTGAGLAGLCGALLTPIYGVWPSVGWTPLVLSFVIIVLGGLGSIKGALVGSLIIGLTHSFVAGYWSPAYADVIMYLVMLAVLLIKPTGLFGQKA
jgi:branched-chain amino acid transport system permease protein